MALRLARQLAKLEGEITQSNLLYFAQGADSKPVPTPIAFGKGSFPVAEAGNKGRDDTSKPAFSWGAVNETDTAKGESSLHGNYTGLLFCKAELAELGSSEVDEGM